MIYSDIFSFYKEELAGETGNYIGDRATVCGKSTSETLHELVGETVDIVERIRSILGEGEARNAWENFAKGYVTFHVYSPRYRLHEVLGDKYRI